MRKLLLLALLCLPLWGQAPAITSLSCEVTPTAARLSWVTDNTAGDAARISYGYAPGTLDRRSMQRNSGSDNGGRRNSYLYDLADNDEIYFNDLSSDDAKTTWAELVCPGNCTNCDTADYSVFANASGCNCSTGNPPSFTTPVEDNDITPDAPVTTALTTPPTITVGDHTHTVASNCSDYATVKAAAETDAGDGDVVKLVMPAQGCGQFNLTAISNGGYVVVTTSADDKLLPPSGALIDKTFLPDLGVVSNSALGQWGFGDSLITASDNARGYYFVGLNVGPPALDSTVLTPLDMAITDINPTTNVITVDDITGLSTGDSIEMVVVDLTGTGITGGYGPLQLCDVTSTTPPAGTFTLSYGLTNKGSCGTQVDLKGTYGSGGTVRRWVALPIEAHGTAASGNHALTITGHGVPNYPNMPITSGSSAVITVTGTPADFQIGSSSESNPLASTVHVEGTGSGTCDGLWKAAVSGSNITLSRTGSTPNCTSVTTGTVHGHRAISLFRTSNATIGDDRPQAFNVEAVDANTLEVLETTAIAGGTGGYLFWDMEQIRVVLDLGKSARSAGVSDITFDRIISRACLPWHQAYWMSIASTDNAAVVNSWIESCAWRRVNPVSGLKERIHGLFQAHQMAEGNGRSGFVWENNYTAPSPFLFNDGDSSCATQDDCWVRDETISRNYFWNPDWAVFDATEFQNHYVHRAFPYEGKSMGPRHEFVGNYLKGWMSDFQQSAPAIEISLNGSNSAFRNGASHVRVESNVFDRGSTILQIGASGRDAHKMVALTLNLSLSNNLIVAIDTPKYNPSDASGYMTLFGSDGFRGFTIDRNTYVPERCIVCRVLSLEGARSSMLKLTDNILGATGGSNTNRTGIFQGALTAAPAATEDGGNAAFEEYFVRGTVTDTGSEISGNIGIPMLVNSSSGTYSVKAASLDPSDAHCVASISAEDKWLDVPINWIGGTDPCPSTLAESVLDRLNTAFESAVWTPKVAYDGKGADPAAIADAMGLPGPVTVEATDTTVTLSFHAPTTDACPVDLAPWTGSWVTTWDAAGDITRAVDPAPDQEQVVEFTSLTAETQYAYRLHCRKGSIGLVTTAGTP